MDGPTSSSPAGALWLRSAESGALSELEGPRRTARKLDYRLALPAIEGALAAATPG